MRQKKFRLKLGYELKLVFFYKTKKKFGLELRTEIRFVLFNEIKKIERELKHELKFVLLKGIGPYKLSLLLLTTVGL